MKSQIIPVRAEHGNFRRHFGDALGVAEFFQWKIADQLQTFSSAPPCNDRRAGFFEILFGPLKRIFVEIALLIIKGDIFRHFEAGDALGKTFLEAMTAKLAVGNNWKPVRFLF